MGPDVVTKPFLFIDRPNSSYEVVPYQCRLPEVDGASSLLGREEDFREAKKVSGVVHWLKDGIAACMT